VFRELFRLTPVIWNDRAVIEPFRVGYVRCSTDEQDVEIQTDQLIALAVPRERIFIDKGFSGTTRKNRTGLDNALTAVTSAAAAVTDRQVVLTTTKFDRFARKWPRPARS
jgi:DNA invertase Pin-like site-specific DNA recombinase